MVYADSNAAIGQRRLSVLMMLVAFGAVAVGLRLFQKQILESPQYRVLAAKQHITRQEIPAKRGRILAKEEYDQNFPLGTDITLFQVMVIPNSVKDYRQVATKLAAVLGIEEKEIFDKINNRKLYLPAIKKHVEKKKAEEIIAMNLAGVVLAPESQRYYPELALAGQVLGFVDADGNGRYGVEGYYDKQLQGSKGVMVAERDSKGRHIAILGREVQEQDGADLVLTIEHNAQFKAEEILAKAMETFKAERGTMVVMDVKTGGIVAMASLPTYDPNQFTVVAKDHPDLFRNPAISEMWEPGSVMKPLVMAAALDRDVVEPETEGVFDSCVTVQGFEICTATKKAFGRETMTQVLENSDNVAMVWIAQQLGNEWLFRYMKGYGFGEKTGIDLAGEASGSVLDLKKWRDINRSTISFGQGIATTPLQLATAYAAIATGGVLIKPHIVETIRAADGTETKIERQEVRRVMKEEAARQATEMLVSVVEKGHGKKARVEGYRIAGKTGTAQVPKPDGGYFEDRHIGSFAGFFPADEPRFAMVVKLDNPLNTQWAESSAAPTFGEMAAWLLSYYRIPPIRVTP